MNGKLIQSHLNWLILKGRRDTTIAARGYALGRLAGTLAMPLLDADEADLTAWRAGLSHLAHASVVAEVGHIRGFYAWAVRYHGLPANPAADLPVPLMPDYQPHPMSEEDLLTAIEGASGRIRLWLVFGGWCGMRPIEMAFLRRNLIREHAPMPHIVIAADATKGGRHGRIIQLCPFAVGQIGEVGLPSSGWAFPRLDGKPGHVTPHLISNVGNRYLHEKCGITAVFYSTRHRFGTELLDQTGNLRLVQEEMGHGDPKVTAKYTKVKNGKAAAAVALLPVPRGLRRAGLADSQKAA